MKRRHFFQKAGALSAGIGLGIHEGVQAEGRGVNYKKQPFAVGINDYKIEYHVPQLKQSVKIMHITDTHLIFGGTMKEVLFTGNSVVEWPKHTMRRAISLPEKLRILKKPLSKH